MEMPLTEIHFAWHTIFLIVISNMDFTLSNRHMYSHRVFLSPYKITLKFFVIAYIMAYSMTGASASMFQKPQQEVVLFSPMEGVITLNGLPAKGAIIERFLKWKDDIGETDRFTTDKNGHFKLPIKKDIVTLNAITTFVVEQKISVTHEDHEYIVWVMGKDSKKEFGELGGEAINLKCDLADDDKPMRLDNALLLTKCKWDSIKKD